MTTDREALEQRIEGWLDERGDISDVKGVLDAIDADPEVRIGRKDDGIRPEWWGEYDKRTHKLVRNEDYIERDEWERRKHTTFDPDTHVATEKHVALQYAMATSAYNRACEIVGCPPDENLGDFLLIRKTYDPATHVAVPIAARARASSFPCVCVYYGEGDWSRCARCEILGVEL